MKKIVSLLMVLVLAISMVSFGASATNASDVGKVADVVSVIEGIDGSNINTVRKLIIAEYQRGIQTRSVKHKGKAYFDYGDSTGEYVHAWVGSKQTTTDGVEFYNRCMNQDFSGGFSDSLGTLGQAENWCCILVTLDSLAKGQAYTVRDGIANAWGNAGATNSEWGMPTDNQKWVSMDGDMYCYQTFDWGYAIALNAQTAFVEWKRYDEGNVAPSGGSYDYDFGAGDIGESAPIYSEPFEYANPITEVVLPAAETLAEQQAQQAQDDAQNGETVTTTEGGEETPEQLEAEAEASAEAEAASEAAASGTASKKASTTGAATTKVTFLGMEVGSAPFIALICGLAAVVVIAIVVIIVVVSKKKKKTPAEVAATDAPAEDDSAKDDTEAK